MKICKYILGSLTIVLALVLVVIYFITKGDTASALAVATYCPEDVTQMDSTVTIAWAIAMLANIVGGVLSVVFAASRKMEVPMIICFAVGLLFSLLYSLMFPCLLWVAIADFIALMFSVSYSQIENDLNGI